MFTPKTACYARGSESSGYNLRMANDSKKKAADGAAAQPKEDLLQAEYIGSGTFIIHKPKRKTQKLRQSRLKSPRRGARK